MQRIKSTYQTHLCATAAAMETNRAFGSKDMEAELLAMPTFSYSQKLADWNDVPYYQTWRNVWW